MKRSRLILLTILMMLVLYCGTVIFLTKPDDFAYSFLFGETRNEAFEATDDQIEQNAQTAAKSETSQPASLSENVVEQASASQDESVSEAIGTQGDEEPVAEAQDVEAEDAKAVSEDLEETDGMTFRSSENPIELNDEEYEKARSQARESAIGELLSTLVDE